MCFPVIFDLVVLFSLSVFRTDLEEICSIQKIEAIYCELLAI